MFEHNLGVDVSGKDFRVCLKVRRADGQIKIQVSRKFPNTTKGFKALVDWMAKKQIRINRCKPLWRLLAFTMSL